MAQQSKVFVSHSQEDDAFCREVVGALRGAGADVWYDEHDLGTGDLMEVIMRELDQRPIFVLILSKSAFASRWVKRETRWAYELYDRDPSRKILPVTAGQIEWEDFSGASGWLFLHVFKRIEAAGMRPFPIAEARGRLLHALELAPATGSPAAREPSTQPTETLVELLSKGKALVEEDKYAEAIPLLERAVQRDPRNFDAQTVLGLAYRSTWRYEEALSVYDRMVTIHPNNADAWNYRGWALKDLKRYDEALAAADHALALNPNNADAWINKGDVLWRLGRQNEALVAYDYAVAADPDWATAWYHKKISLRALGRMAEAEEAERRVQELKRTS